jgi:hypothetical protein
MDDKQKDSAAAKRNRAGGFFALRLAAAAYLAWLGFDLLHSYLAGSSGLPAALAWGSGVGFLAAGLGFGIYSFRRYRRETAEAEDPPEQNRNTPDGE